jgi:hypothetical protein
MEHHIELSDAEFSSQFELCTLDPKLFTHEAHVRLAWIHIRQSGVEKAIGIINQQLLDFVSAIGATEKYNQTLTTAAIKAVHHFMLKSQTSSFQEFIQENSRLNTQFKDLLFTHYKTNIFKSDKAKGEYLEPELLPFD